MISRYAMPLQRKYLPHDVPHWVSDGSRYFITINCKERGGDLLIRTAQAKHLLESIPVYEEAGKWFVHVLVVMPDHVHLIASFGNSFSIRAVISSWKKYHARLNHIDWQFNYFEHRLRNDDEFAEKYTYVLMNPVRKRLVTDWQERPHKFLRGSR